MALVRLLVALSALMCAWAAVQDDCMSLKYVNLHSQDMVVDFRNSWLQGDDTARFKRDMQGGRNPDAHANEFWVIYKSRVGIKKFSTMLNFYRYANLPPEQDRSFLTSTDGVTWSPFTAFTESADLPTGNDAYFIRKYTLLLPDETYFVQMKFANWVYSGSINYWTPQIHNVTFTEVCDSCGNGVCGDGSNSFGEPENCNNCPADCGRCSPPTCGNGVCEFGESWAPRDGVNTMDMGPLTCPEDCGFIQTPGNLRCDTGEVCHSQTQRSCADCCPTDTFVVNTGDCGNGLCDGSETCTTCAGDCGACPSCGDGLCNGVETCRTCVADCGACPDPATCTTAAPPPPSSMPPPPLTSAPPPPVTSAPPPPPLTTAVVPPLTTAAPPSPQRTTEAPPPSVPQETSAAPPPPPDTSAPPPTSQAPASPSPSFSSGDDNNVHVAGAHKSVSKTAVVLISVFSVLAAVAIMVGAFLLFRHLRAAEPKLKAAQEPNAP